MGPLSRALVKDMQYDILTIVPHVRDFDQCFGAMKLEGNCCFISHHIIFPVYRGFYIANYGHQFYAVPNQIWKKALDTQVSAFILFMPLLKGCLH